MSEFDLIDRYVRELGASLKVGGPHQQRVLSEVRDHLVEAAEAEMANGKTLLEAQRSAIHNFGLPDELAALFDWIPPLSWRLAFYLLPVMKMPERWKPWTIREVTRPMFVRRKVLSMYPLMALYALYLHWATNGRVLRFPMALILVSVPLWISLISPRSLRPDLARQYLAPSWEYWLRSAIMLIVFPLAIFVDRRTEIVSDWGLPVTMVIVLLWLFSFLPDGIRRYRERARGHR